ncbi:hypothetical protein [Caudoviricetes sp.]|nr:hypothetical protein [Caudoviricetes sp.]
MLPAYQINPDPYGQSMRYAGESIRNALMAYGKQAREEQERMGLVESFGRIPELSAQAQSLAKNTEVARNVLAQYMNPMLPIHRQQMETSAAQHAATLAENRRMHDQTIMQQNRLYDLQAGQIRNASPEGRAAYALQAGIQRGTPEFNEFVFGIKRPDFADQLIARMGQTPSPATMSPSAPQPPAAMSPSPSMPGPRLMPQSFDGGRPQGDPNLIRVQSAAPSPAQPAPQTVNTPMGQMSQDQARQLGFALALKGKGEAGKMMAESNPDALGKEGANLVDKNAVGQFDAIGRLESMAREFDPNLQTKQARMGQWFNQQLAGWGALTPQKQAELSAFVQQRAAAINNFNLRLKEASGTAVSAQEFERNQAELPNPGTGIMNGVFDGDDPVTYAAKMRKGISLLKMGMARNLYLKNKGFKGGVDDAAKVVPVEQMPAVINKRGAEIEQQILQANPKADKAAIDQVVKDVLKKEFGI